MNFLFRITWFLLSAVLALAAWDQTTNAAYLLILLVPWSSAGMVFGGKREKLHQCCELTPLLAAKKIKKHRNMLCNDPEKLSLSYVITVDR